MTKKIDVTSEEFQNYQDRPFGGVINRGPGIVTYAEQVSPENLNLSEIITRKARRLAKVDETWLSLNDVSEQFVNNNHHEWINEFLVSLDFKHPQEWTRRDFIMLGEVLGTLETEIRIARLRKT